MSCGVCCCCCSLSRWASYCDVSRLLGLLCAWTRICLGLERAGLRVLVLLLPWLLSRWGVLSLLLLRVQQGLVVAGEEDHLKELSLIHI